MRDVIRKQGRSSHSSIHVWKHGLNILHGRHPGFGFKVEQIKSIDFTSRKIKFVAHAPQDVLNEVLSILDACLYQDA